MNNKNQSWALCGKIENTVPGIELPRIFCAWIGPLQHGVVLVIIFVIFKLFERNSSHQLSSWNEMGRKMLISEVLGAF